MQVARASSVVAVLAATAGSASAQVTIRLNVPRSTPPDAVVHVAGNFNGWNPGASEYRLERRGEQYIVTLPEKIRGPIEFKFTLGSWDRVETTATGSDVDNRTFIVPAGTSTFDATVAAWRSGPPPARKPTRTRSVTVIPSFEAPQLGGSRRVWVYLPPDYATSSRRYPVLYMHDGQNVFDDSTSFAGEWGVDEALDSLHAAGDPGVIVIAVDHGGQERMREYSPWPTQFGEGKGEAYAEFLVTTLKPWADRTYRTLPDRAHTGILGSSMGGLISLYAALRHPDVFGRAGVFSPSLWIAPAIYDMAARTSFPDGARIYIVSGGQEGADADVSRRNQERMVATLAGRGLGRGTHVAASIVPDGRHTESFWRREFPAAYQWLFSNASK
jgi:metallo-beta-lactamase class B